MRLYANFDCSDAAQTSSTDEVPAAPGATATVQNTVHAKPWSNANAKPLPFNTYISQTPVNEKLLRYHVHNNGGLPKAMAGEGPLREVNG